MKKFLKNIIGSVLERRITITFLEVPLCFPLRKIPGAILRSALQRELVYILKKEHLCTLNLGNVSQINFLKLSRLKI